ncbi:MAG: phosphoribosyltransferase [Bdellovibrionota bacterium]
MKLFQDREQAARLLSARLKKYKGRNPLVLGIPRGAMPMAEIIAADLDGELGAVLVHKIPAPENEEFAIGSIGLSGKIHRNLDLSEYGISEEYLQAAAQEQLTKLKARQQKFHLKEPQCQGRVAIVVDDGIATGATAISAIREVRALKPKTLVLAAGVVARETAERIRPMVDDFVVLNEPELFWAVGNFFTDFAEVTDDMVEKILKRNRMPKEKLRGA